VSGVLTLFKVNELGVCGGGCEVLSKIGVDSGEVKDQNARCCRAPIGMPANVPGWCRGGAHPPMVIAQYRGKLCRGC